MIHDGGLGQHPLNCTHPLTSSVKEFPSKYIDCVLAFSHARILLHYGDVRIPKPKNRVLEIENRNESNQSWKTKTTQP